MGGGEGRLRSLLMLVVCFSWGSMQFYNWCSLCKVGCLSCDVVLVLAFFLRLELSTDCFSPSKAIFDPFHIDAHISALNARCLPWSPTMKPIVEVPRPYLIFKAIVKHPA
jgi:hypothetical protein